MRKIIAVLAAFLPQHLKRLLYRHYFHWTIDRRSFVGFSYILVDDLRLEKGVRVGHGNVIKGCRLVHLREGVLVGAFNWITAAGVDSGLFPSSPQRQPRLIVGPQASITSRHVIDCSDEVRIGPLASLAGLRSQVLTHGIDVGRAAQLTAPVEIGARSLVSTGCTLLAGSIVPPESVVAAGAVVTGDLVKPHQLYGGVPARALKSLPAESAFFHRTLGYVH